MSLRDAVVRVGPIPPGTAVQAIKKRYSEVLSRELAYELAAGLQGIGFTDVKPEKGGAGELEFQGGLGPKRVDVSYSDRKHGLLLALSVKTICFEPYGKNLKNRFADLCVEAVTLHMRFPYAVVGALFAMPDEALTDRTARRTVSTFRRALNLMSTISGRISHSEAPERFETVTMMLFRPERDGGPAARIWLFDVNTGERLSEAAYFAMLRDRYDRRNPHAMIGE